MWQLLQQRKIYHIRKLGNFKKKTLECLDLRATTWRATQNPNFDVFL